MGEPLAHEPTATVILAPDRVVLPSDPDSAGEARRFVGAACLRSGVSETMTATAVLLISEAVTNAVAQRCGDIALSVRASATAVRLEVSDNCGDYPALRTTDALGEDGRGMAIIDALATSWGVEARPIGKVVWMELRTDPARGAVEPRRPGS